MRSRRARLLGVATVVLVTVLITTPALAADYPRVLLVDASRSPEISVTLVVPPLLSGAALPAAAFRVSDGGRPHQVTRAVPSPTDALRLILVIDTAVRPDDLAAEQGAARELLVRLPPTAQAGLISSGSAATLAAPLGTDRQETITALVGLQPQADAPADRITPALGLALRQLQPAGRLDVVIAVDANPVTRVVPDPLSRSASGAAAAIYTLVWADPPIGYLGGLPEGTGGRVVRVAAPNRLVSAYDTVLDELASRYRVDFSSPGQDSHVVQIAVDAQGVHAATSFIIQPPAPHEVVRSHRSRLGIGLPALVVVVALLSLVVRWRANRAY